MKLSPPIRPSDTQAASAVSPHRPSRLMVWLRRRRWFMLFVVLPTLLTAAYYATYAADIYESEARFLVRGRNAPSASSASAIAGLLGGGGAANPSMTEQRAVGEFIDSHAAISGLRQSLDLAAIWRRPEADLLAMLWYESPEAERLLRYYRRRVTVAYDIETGISTLRVQAFRAEDAHAIALELLRLSEDLVNRLTARTQADTLRVAREEVQIAERRVIAAREALTAFREREQAMDPTASATAALGRVGALEATLAQTRAELQERQAFMRPDNPQVQVLRNRISALTTQIAEERARMTQGREALPQQMSAYERLQLERGFADQALTSAITSLEAARAEAQRQQVFLQRIVEPNLAERALYPTGAFNTLTVLVSLLIAYGIGWLMLAGAREHAN